MDKKKYVLITGTATGIGKATTLKFAAEGWDVIACKLPFQDGQQYSGNSRIHVLDLDVTDEPMIRDTVSQVSEICGENGLAAIINNAGVVLASGILESVSIDEAKTCYDINVFGMMRVIQNFLPLLRQYGKGKILNLASGAVHAPVPGSGVYNSSKFAVIGVTNTLRLELAPFGIQVSALEPSAVKSEMTKGGRDKNKANWDGLPPDLKAVYTEPLAPTVEWLSGQVDNAIEPEIIADKLYWMANQRKLKMRYGGGKTAEQLVAMASFLGENRFEGVLKKILKVNQGTHVGFTG